MSRAVRYDNYGDVDVLNVVEVEDPVPGRGQLLVRVKAAGINPGEAKIRDGMLAERFPSTFPSGQGSDLAGVVERIGEGVDDFAVGDEVIGFTDERASQAELVVIPAENATRKPAGVPWEVAGGLFVVGATAWASVRAVGVSSGDTVVVSGAAGGVGVIAVQLARRAGATVIGLASERHHEWLRAHGVVPVVYGDGVGDRIREAAPDGVDAFLDMVGGGYVELALELGVSPRADQHDRRLRGHREARRQVRGQRRRCVGCDARRTGGAHRRRRAGGADRGHLLARSGARRLPRAGRQPHARQDRAAAVILTP